MKKVLLTIFLSLVALISQAQEVIKLQETIPFRNDLGLIIIPISFNGVEKQFIFDTGAQGTIVFSWAQEELKRTSKRVKVTSSNGSKTKLRIYKSGVIRLGNKEIKDHTSIMAGDSNIFGCHNIDGVLGVDVIKLYNWTIDYASHQLIMYDKAYFPPSVDLMNPLDFTFKKNVPSVHTTINGSNIRFLLDTGAGNSDLKEKDYSISSLKGNKYRKVYSGFYDLNGTLTPTESFEMQLLDMTSNTLSLVPIVAFGGKTTKIGNSLWGESKLFLSLANEKLLVSKTELIEDVKGYECGVVFSDGKMRVMGIYENSAAWDAGIRQGDVVISFNDKIFTDFCSFDKYQRNAVVSGREITLEFNNGKRIQVKKTSLF